MIGDAVKANYPYFDVCISNTPYQVGNSTSMPSPYITSNKIVPFFTTDIITACIPTPLPPTIIQMRHSYVST
jgi:hypothetical protein